VAQKGSHYHESTLNRIKRASKAGFSTNIEYKMSTRMWLVCLKYFMCELISEVFICCVWSCETDKFNASDIIMF